MKENLSKNVSTNLSLQEENLTIKNGVKYGSKENSATERSPSII